MTSLDPESFWSVTLRPYIGNKGPAHVVHLIKAVEEVFQAWSTFFGVRQELPIAYPTRYFIDDRPLSRTAGLVQIEEYAEKNNIRSLISVIEGVSEHLKAAKNRFFE